MMPIGEKLGEKLRNSIQDGLVVQIFRTKIPVWYSLVNENHYQKSLPQVRGRCKSPPPQRTFCWHLAVSLSSQGKYDEAEKMQREVLAVKQRVLGAEHPTR